MVWHPIRFCLGFLLPFSMITHQRIKQILVASGSPFNDYTMQIPNRKMKQGKGKAPCLASNQRSSSTYFKLATRPQKWIFPLLRLMIKNTKGWSALNSFGGLTGLTAVHLITPTARLSYPCGVQTTPYLA